MIALWWAAAFAQAPVSETLVTASVVVAVPQQEDAADAVVAKAKEVGGWFQSRTTGAVSLRIPSDKLEEVLAFAEQRGKVVDKAMARQDLHAELADLRGRVLARREVLDQYYQVLRSASSDSVVSVQYQVTQAVEQIELLEGRIRLLEDQAAHARLDVAFQFRDRAAPARTADSSFAWLNTLNVQDVIDSFRYVRPSFRTGGVGVTTPDGFSTWRKGGWRAASPDDVLMRVRTQKHKPRAELSFWIEAVRERSKAAGYKVLSEAPIEASGVKGGLIELAAPLGTEDWTYLIAFFPSGSKVVVAEAAGRITDFEARKASLLASIGALELR